MMMILQLGEGVGRRVHLRRPTRPPRWAAASVLYRKDWRRMLSQFLQQCPHGAAKPVATSKRHTENWQIAAQFS